MRLLDFHFQNNTGKRIKVNSREKNVVEGGNYRLGERMQV